MQSLSLPSARRPAPAAVGGGRHSRGLPYVGRQPLAPDQGDATLGWDHCKHFNVCMESDTSACPSAVSLKVSSIFTTLYVSADPNLSQILNVGRGNHWYRHVLINIRLSYVYS